LLASAAKSGNSARGELNLIQISSSDKLREVTKRFYTLGARDVKFLALANQLTALAQTADKPTIGKIMSLIAQLKKTLVDGMPKGSEKSTKRYKEFT
jgi:hypothetical protein